MKVNQPPLRYRITDWHQLSKCQSNNSKYLHISVTDFIQDNDLIGLRITIKHAKFGDLFTTLLSTKGRLISKSSNGTVHELSRETILEELNKFGFKVEWVYKTPIKPAQFRYLQTLWNLNYDKLRILNVWEINKYGIKDNTLYVVVFKQDKLPYWLNNGYSPSKKEFSDALVAGDCMNISKVGDRVHHDDAYHTFKWDWLVDYVANIDDILHDPAYY